MLEYQLMMTLFPLFLSNRNLLWQLSQHWTSTQVRGQIHGCIQHVASKQHCHIFLIDLNIDAQQYKVFPGTEKDVYHNGFFQRQDLVVNALDNVEARRYVDGRCVTNLRPLLESGTMGAKGHVQVPPYPPLTPPPLSL